MEENLIHVVITGGTIDSKWNNIQDTIVMGEESAIPAYFNSLKLDESVTFTTVCLKDSRALTDDDREAMRKVLEESSATKIILTHGIYTMPDTVKYLKKHLTRQDQTIVLTGATSPLKGFDITNAPFNLGYAVAKVQELPPGIYVCMKAKTFDYEQVSQTLAKGRFYSIFLEK